MKINWRTTAAGLFVVGAAVFETLLQTDIPGFNMDLGTAFAVGIGLAFAADART